MRSDIFLRLPPPTALLLLFSIIDLTSAHASYDLPRRTAAAADALPDQYRALDISPYPPIPTAAPLQPSDLRRRQELNTVCGYIGGDPGLPATCSAGSHCVLEAAHGVIGCCPDGQDPCTTGIFTACVDGNSPAQRRDADPYAFTCTGSDVCYKNVFEGGFFQFGCGSASSLAATVFASASGLSATIDRPSLTISFSETPSAKTVSDSSTDSSDSSSDSSTASRTSSRARTTVTVSSSSSSGSGTSTSPTLTGAATEKSTAAPPAAGSGTGNTERAADHTGAIVGGTISGIAVLIALVAAGIFLWRRRNQRRNQRQGPGPGPKDVMTEYISPQMGGGGGGGPAGGAAAFQPLHQSYEAWEAGLAPGSAVAYPAQTAPAMHPASHSGVYAVGGEQTMGGGERLHGDMVPLTREIDDFSRGFHDALGRIDEEDHTSSASTEVTYHNAGMPGTGSEAGMPSHDENGRPLWQQNRRLSRNMMWM